MQTIFFGAIMATQVLNVYGVALYGYEKSDCSDPVSVHSLTPGQCYSLGGRHYWNTGQPAGRYVFYDNEFCLTDHIYATCGSLTGNTHCNRIGCINASGSGPYGVIYRP
jgi:hypothetical protein